MTPRTKREYLRELVADKNRWSRPLTDEEHAIGPLASSSSSDSHRRPTRFPIASVLMFAGSGGSLGGLFVLGFVTTTFGAFVRIGGAGLHHLAGEFAVARQMKVVGNATGQNDRGEGG